MKKPVIKKTTIIPLWQRELTLLIGADFNYVKDLAIKSKLSQATINEIVRDNLDHKTTDGCAYFCQEQGVSIVWFPFKKVAPEIIAHEVTHVVDELMMFIGAVKEHEARAYTVEWVYKFINDTLKR